MRIIKAVVIIMGVVIIVGTGVLFWQMYTIGSKRDSARGATTPVAPIAVPTGATTSGAAAMQDFGTVSLGLPAGCEIADARIGAGRLVVRTSCGEVRILDLATGAPLGRVTR